MSGFAESVRESEWSKHTLTQVFTHTNTHAHRTSHTRKRVFGNAQVEALLATIVWFVGSAFISVYI